MEKQVKRVPIQVRIPIISDKQFDCPYEEPFGYVYLIINKVNGHLYVGKHEFHYPWLDKNYCGSGKRLQLAYKKYGIKNFDIIILEWTDKDSEKLFNLEKYWINMFGTFVFPFHYNETEGGEGFLGGELHPFYGTHKTEKDKQRISMKLSGKNSPWYGKKFSESHKEKLRLSHLSNEISENCKRVLSEMNSGEKNYFYGKHFYGKENPTSKPVVKLSLGGDYIESYETISEAAKSCEGSVGTLAMCCKGQRNKHKGYKWVYKEDYNKLI